MISKYEDRHGELVRNCERGLIKTGLKDVLDIPADAADWLRYRRYLTSLIANIINGEAGTPTRPKDFIYYLFRSDPSYWSRKISDRDYDGPYTTHLRETLCESVSTEDIYQYVTDFGDLINDVPDAIERSSKTYEIEQFDYRKQDPNVLNRLQQRSTELEEVSVYLHGSMATRDHTSFSDIDDFVVLNQDSWDSFSKFERNVERLGEMAKKMYEYDPLQHHGHWVFTHFDLNCFDPSRMSPSILKTALRLAGERKIELSVISSSQLYSRPLWSIVQVIRHGLSSIERGDINLFQLKKLVSAISLMPALLAQIEGIEIDKKTAIQKKEELLIEEALSGVNWATNIRRHWSDVPKMYRTNIIKVFNRATPFNRVVSEELSRRYAPNIRTDEVPFLNTRIMNSISRLSDQGGNAVLEVYNGSN